MQVAFLSMSHLSEYKYRTGNRKWQINSPAHKDTKMELPQGLNLNLVWHPQFYKYRIALYALSCTHWTNSDPAKV